MSFVGTILDGGGGVYGWVGRSTDPSVPDEVVACAWDGHRFATADEAVEAAQALRDRLVAEGRLADLYAAAAEPDPDPGVAR